ncbi:MAG: glycosyltransferase family 2 protein [Armatimonadetes bacterium]|nr:glycosyltransferase family 2 protein [Armatimonadota bacterium]
MSPGAPVEITVVAPIHNEATAVEHLFRGIVAALEPLGREFEVLLVNDASTDGSGALLDQLARQDSRLHPLHLERNAGEAAALSAGFALARGAVVLTLDGDLQNDPADLPRLLERLEQDGLLAVSGRRVERREAFGTRILPSRAANWLIRAVTGVPVHDTGCGLKAYRAEVVRGIALPDGLHRFLPVVLGVSAERFAELPVLDRPRRGGASHYGLTRLFAVLRDLTAVRFLPDRTAAGLRNLSRAAGVGLILSPAGMLLLLSGHFGVGLALAGLGVLLWGYGSAGVRVLTRWQDVQVAPPYRLRSPASRCGAEGTVGPADAASLTLESGFTRRGGLRSWEFRPVRPGQRPTPGNPRACGCFWAWQHWARSARGHRWIGCWLRCVRCRRGGSWSE